MSDSKDLIELPKNVVATLALEVWRLWRTLEKPEMQTIGVRLRYSIRKMKDSLEAHGCTFIDATGKVYDAGMAVDIIDTEGKKTSDESERIVKEMIVPTIVFNDVLLKHGQVILEWKTKIENPVKGA